MLNLQKTFDYSKQSAGHLCCSFDNLAEDCGLFFSPLVFATAFTVLVFSLKQLSALVN